VTNSIRISIKTAFVVLCLLLTASCEGKYEKKSVGSNPKVVVEVVTRFEGLILYRVRAGDEKVFVAARDNGQISANWTISRRCGKNCTDLVPRSVQTVNK
jgi:hypothetical protein